jgi:uncharacterized NAD-dependent epimerase/dehydratase family protein
MSNFPEGSAIIYCEGAFGTTNGKTAHGLVRRCIRYKILSVIDSSLAGKDAGSILDGKTANIPIYTTLEEAVASSKKMGSPATHFVMGLTPDGGRLSNSAKDEVKNAIKFGLNVDSGLHDFLSEDYEVSALANKYGIKIRDVRKPPNVNGLHFFSGKIEEVKSLKIAYLGTDSAVGKRTSAWILTDELNKKGYKTELIGTGQTAWFQGVQYGIILDSLVNDFVAGEIEHIIWTAWNNARPDVIILEGQGSIMNPAYPGGFELLAAGRPDIIILQHVPGRIDYDGFPGYTLHPIEKQIKAIEQLSEKPVVAITINHEHTKIEEIPTVCRRIAKKTGLPAFDILVNGANDLVKELSPYLAQLKEGYA